MHLIFDSQPQRMRAEEVQHLAYDAWRFVQEFQVPLTEVALSTYTSALPFTPKECSLYKHFNKLVRHGPTVLRGVPSSWTTCLSILEGHNGSVISALFSPDGKQIVSASKDTTLRIWDAATGAAIGGP